MSYELGVGFRYINTYRRSRVPPRQMSKYFHPCLAFSVGL